MQTAEPANPLVAGAQHQMKGIAQQHLGADVLDVARRHAFHRPVGAARHEHRRLNRPPGRLQNSSPGLTAFSFDFEFSDIH